MTDRQAAQIVKAAVGRGQSSGWVDAANTDPAVGPDPSPIPSHGKAVRVMTSLQSTDIPSEGHPKGHAGTHLPSHQRLLAPVPRYLPGPRQERLALSGLVVPTVRPAGMGSGLALASRFAEAKDGQLVVIRSGLAAQRPFQDAMVPRTSSRTVVIDLPPGADRILPFPSNELLVATLHRQNDLGLKRNLGLLIARMCGWEAMLYLDDDIRSTPASQSASANARRTDPLVRLDDVMADFASYPDVHAAGYFQRDMDDNSVVCHARRLVGRPQEIFISGGALAVRASGPLPFFSQAYSEDWLFLLPLILEGRHTLPSSAVRYVGTIHQDTYYPFTVPRARSEELGDLLAEGLYSLIGEPREDLLATASSVSFWEQAVDERSRMISELLADVYRLGNGTRQGVMADAEQALQAARSVYTDPEIEAAEELAEFFVAMLADQKDWSDLLTSMTPSSPNDTLSIESALETLGLAGNTQLFGGPQKGQLSRHAS
jgi:hypothetical protein